MEITLAVILSYISNYLLAFVISLLGAFTNEMMTAVRTKTKINIFRVLAPGIFDGFLLCALQSYFKMSFAIYAFICFIIGMWGIQIIETISNHKFVTTFLKIFLKISSSSLMKAAGECMTTLDEEKESKKNTKIKKPPDEKKTD